jgi:argininosuccinate synthase
MIMKVVLAYSGGLDTTVSIALLKEKFDAEVITFTADVGQKDDFVEIENKAYKAGAAKHVFMDLKQEFADNYIKPCIKMNCLYEDKYPLGTALARPLIAKYAVLVAKKEGADAIAHGSTSKGNDQVRFDLTIMAEAPDKESLTPVRKFKLTREWEIKYALEKGLPVSIEHKKYSIDDNLWSRSIEGGPLDDESNFPEEDAFEWTVSPEKAPDSPEIHKISFKNGEPVALDDEKMNLVDLVKMLNVIGGRNGFGRIDMIESRVVGIKSREVYEAPAALILIESHKDLERTVLTPKEYRFKRLMDNEWSDLVYSGLWYEPLRSELQALGEELNKYVEGDVWVKLYKGSLMIIGRKSRYSLYRKDIADYNKGWYPTEDEARGFIKLWGNHSINAKLIREKF